MRWPFAVQTYKTRPEPNPKGSLRLQHRKLHWLVEKLRFLSSDFNRRFPSHRPESHLLRPSSQHESFFCISLFILFFYLLYLLLKVLYTAGWEDSLADPAVRSKWVNDTINTMLDNNMDGINVDIEN